MESLEPGRIQQWQSQTFGYEKAAVCLHEYLKDWANNDIFAHREELHEIWARLTAADIEEYYLRIRIFCVESEF